MSRLVYSSAAMARASQMSQAEIHIYVEGNIERPCIDRILDFCGYSQRCKIISARELPGDTGGKNRLLLHFNYLNENNCLATRLAGKRTLQIFYLDKDVDDLTGRTVISDHVVYTSSYDIEGDLIASGNIHRAVADGLQVTAAQVQQVIGEKSNFLQICAQNWLHWIRLCMVNEYSNAKVGCGYSRPSAINPDPLGEHEHALWVEFEAAVKEKLLNQYDYFLEQCDSALALIYESREYLQVFKGKWFTVIFQKIAELLKSANANSAGQRVFTALVAQVGRVDCVITSTIGSRIHNLLEK